MVSPRAFLFVTAEVSLLTLDTMSSMVSLLRALTVVSFGSFVGLVACAGNPSEGLSGDGLGGEEGQGSSGTSGNPGASSSGGSSSNGGGSSNGGTCAPKCEGKVCGGDGCGGTCGTCSGNQSCDPGGSCVTAVPAGVTCPPTGGTGKTAGKVVLEGDVPLKQGGTYSLRPNCAKPIYVLGLTESCGICMAHLAQWTKPGGFYDQLKAEGVDVVLIHATNPSGQAPSAAETTTLVGKYDLTRYIVGTDAKGNGFDSFIGKRSGYGGARIAIAIKAGNVIGQVGQIDSETEIRSALGLK